ncbi:MAG: outer membrane beta-barrel protein [Puia sp.]
MKKFFSMALILFVSHAALAQDSTAGKKKPVSPVITQDTVVSKKKAKMTYESLNLANRPNDHFMIELGYDNWAGKPDTIRTTGLSRSFAFYFMMDFPFKTDPHFSVGAGLGIGVSNIYFDKQLVLVEATGNGTLAFPDRTNGDHFKKYKLVNTFLEIPLEIRYAFNPENTNKSWKIAVGLKPGLMLSAYTKGKNLYNAAGQLEQAFTEKNSSKQFFNGTRVAASLRISYGFIGLFGQYQLTSLIKSGAGPAINPYSIGIVLSGL